MTDPEPLRDTPTETTAGSGLLPEPVRLRSVALAAEALGRIPADQLPAPLRRVAAFAPARRAKVAATQIAASLESDDAFRDRVATQVRSLVPQIAAALDEQSPPPAADPVETAAVAYLLRTEGWADLVETARNAGPGTEQRDQSDVLERLQRQLAEARVEVRAVRDKGKEQLAEVKRDNADLRRKLNEMRQQVTAAEKAARESGEAHESARKEAAGLEAEARRLRTKLAELEASASAARRAVRDDRDYATIRARLLLDTLLDSARGLRRELALPPVTGSPADAVEGVTADAGGTTQGTGMARPTNDPALLEELLALPRVRVLIDGYNVTKTAWPTSPLENQRSRLLSGLAALAARNRAEMTVVFDGADLTAPPPVSSPRGVRVRFSPPGVIADDVIRDLLDVEPGGRAVVVISSDREVAAAAHRAGARAVESIALVRLLARS